MRIRKSGLGFHTQSLLERIVMGKKMGATVRRNEVRCRANSVCRCQNRRLEKLVLDYKGRPRETPQAKEMGARPNQSLGVFS